MADQESQPTKSSASRRSSSGIGMDQQAEGGLDITTDDKFPSPKKLAWKIDDDIRRALEQATVDLDRFSPKNSLSFKNEK